MVLKAIAIFSSRFLISTSVGHPVPVSLGGFSFALLPSDVDRPGSH
jgi:hypothetical protein